MSKLYNNAKYPNKKTLGTGYGSKQKALLDGYEFILSKNRVILCTGNEFGFLPSTYINCIKDRKSGNIV